MAGAEFRHAQRQFAIAAEALVEDLHMAGAVHRLQREDAVLLQLVLDGRDEHALAELLPMAGGFPQLAVHQLRRLHLLVLGEIQTAAHIGFDRPIEAPALRVPEDAADRFFLQMEQVHLLADLAVVALLRFLQLEEIGIQLLLVAPGGAVDPAEHRVAVIAAPIGAGHLHQLEGGADIARAAHMRPTAQIDPVSLLVERYRLALRQVLDQLDLVLLALRLEQRDGVVAGGDDPLEGRIRRDDLAHLRLDAGEILGREGLVAVEVVIEAVLDGRADGHLGAGEQHLHGFGQHMGGVVPDHLQRLVVLAGDEAQAGIGGDCVREVAQLAIHFHGERGLGEARADGGGHRRTCNRAVEAADGTVGQGDRGHRCRDLSGRAKPAAGGTRGAAGLAGVRSRVGPRLASSGRGRLRFIRAGLSGDPIAAGALHAGRGREGGPPPMRRSRAGGGRRWRLTAFPGHRKRTPINKPRRTSLRPARCRASG